MESFREEPAGLQGGIKRSRQDLQSSKPFEWYLIHLVGSGSQGRYASRCSFHSIQSLRVCTWRKMLAETDLLSTNWLHNPRAAITWHRNIRLFSFRFEGEKIKEDSRVSSVRGYDRLEDFLAECSWTCSQTNRKISDGWHQSQGQFHSYLTY
jgi:hypothetical protein